MISLKALSEQESRHSEIFVPGALKNPTSSKPFRDLYLN